MSNKISNSRQMRHWRRCYKDPAYRARVLAAARKARQDNLEKWKARELAAGLKRNYGLTVEAYETMLLGQNGCCALCDQPPRGTRNEKRLHVDHCHKTGRVRGLLCGTCNRKLVAVEDAAFLARARAYLA